MAWYANSPGDSGIPPELLSAGLPVKQQENHFQLLMFVHPRCACTRSSLRELERLLAQCPDRVTCTFFCYLPESESTEWARTNIMAQADSLPDSHVIPDAGGRWAREFDIKTSGHVLLYDPEGTLKFNGGITVGRGHEGESRGRTFIASVIRDQDQSHQQYPVFGCPIIQ